ncbi:Viral A-type inclusion protein repeat-containing domain protein [Dirofilaria immitis]|nr:Viral A-type inclusion protein repeat-containing domain protein [Dirofilaria immitis]
MLSDYHNNGNIVIWQQWENQKRALEAKQPMDVQMLQGQKRELTMQLDREQAEKQELFLQINSLIAQLADANRDTSDTQEFNILKDENEKLNKQIADILIVQSQLNTDVQNLQEEVQRKSQEVENANDESKNFSNIEELQRDLQMKSAELQSLMLAKQDIKTSEADSAMITRLTVENEELRDQINEIENEVKRRVSEIEEVKSENEEKLKNLQSELDSMRENARINEAELSKQSDEISQMSELREALEKHKLDAEKISKQLEESQKNLAECEKIDLDIYNLQRHFSLPNKEDSEAKLMRENDTLTDIKEKFEEEIRQQEIKFNNLKQSLKAEAMKTQEAEQEVKSYRIKFTDLEEELKILRTQIDNQRNIDEQMRMLHEELKQAKHKIVAQATDLEKAEIDADEAERSTRETIDELEEEIRSLQEKLKVLEIGEEKQSKRLLLAEEEMMKIEKYERKCEMLTKDLEEVRAALGDANAILEKFKTENEKLLAKASLEDEVLTLATSLQSARDDISIKHDEIAKLRKELREAHEENKRLLIDIDVQTQTLQQDVQLARSECDKMRTEMEKCKNDGIVQQQKDSLILAGLRNEISKLEEQLVKKEKMLVSLRDDLEMKQQKILLETKQQYEQQIAELNNEMEKLRVSESEKIDELNAVMTNLRKKLAVKGGNVASFRNDQYYEIENKEVQKLDLSPRADFEEKLAALKECIADVLEEKLSLEQRRDRRRRHIISVNDDDDEEEALKRIDKNVLLLKQEIDHFEHNHADRSYNITGGRIWKSKSSSEVWNLRAELAFLKKQITDEEMDRKHLQNHIQMLQATIQENEEILDLMKEKENDIKTDKYDSEKRSNPFVEQIEKLKKDIENLTNDIISCKKRLDESSRLEERNRLIEFENRRLFDECSSLKMKQLHKARQACELSGAEMDRLREQSDILSKEVNHLRNFLNIANTEKEQLKIEALERLKEVEQLSREQMELEVTRQQLDEAIAESERQAQELARLKVQVKSDEGLERDRQQEIHNLHQQIQTVEDIERLTSELEVERKRVTDLGEDSPELKRKLSELMAENAHLAGELLKKHNLEDKELSKQNQQMEELLKNDENWKCKEKLLREENREKLKKAMEDFERRLQQCNEEWTIKSNNQMKILKREMDRMNDENEELRSQNERIRKEMDDMRHEVKMNKQALQDSVERLRESDSNFSRLEAGYDTPTPPPRKRTGSEVTADGTLHLSLSEENKKLKKDIEMQHRLIVVLRRKLQSIQQQQRQKSDL